MQLWLRLSTGDWGWSRSHLGWGLVSPAWECHRWKDILQMGLEMEQALL